MEKFLIFFYDQDFSKCQTGSSEYVCGLSFIVF